MRNPLAPWTEQEVANLKAYQESGQMHPFTCPNHTVLTPTTNGWVCTCCDYTQQWAHPFMLEWPNYTHLDGST